MSDLPADTLTTTIANALRKSRLTWGTHSDRWTDTEWQDEFWGEAAEVAAAAVVSVLATHNEQVAAIQSVLADWPTCLGCFAIDHPCGRELCALRARLAAVSPTPPTHVDVTDPYGTGDATFPVPPTHTTTTTEDQP
jgi:hypothetical protein